MYFVSLQQHNFRLVAGSLRARCVVRCGARALTFERKNEAATCRPPAITRAEQVLRWITEVSE